MFAANSCILCNFNSSFDFAECSRKFNLRFCLRVAYDCRLTLYFHLSSTNLMLLTLQIRLAGVAFNAPGSNKGVENIG